MRKGKLLRSVLAMGMAAALTALPMGAYAETIDESELAEKVEAAVEDSVEELTGSAYEGHLNVDFGDGLYHIFDQSGTDLSWLKNVSASGRIVPGEGTIDGELVYGLNDSQLCTLLVSYDAASGTVYASIPEFFDQTIAVNPQEFVQNIMSGSSGEESSSMTSQITQLIAGMGMEIAGQVQEFLASLPEDVWQQEIMSYVMPIVNHMQQENSQDVLTVGDLSADVQTQTISIPSDSMGEVISGTLSAAAQDKVAEALLQSDAASSIFSLVSMVSGGAVQLNGQEVLDQMRGVLESAASADFSGIPGIVIRTQSSEDGNAVGYETAMEADGQEQSLFLFKAVQDGTENAFEVQASPLLMTMYGAGEAGGIALQGHGSTEGGKLNEEIDLLAGGQSVAKFSVTDFDLAALEADGSMIGTFRFESGEVSGDVTYGVLEDGTRPIVYRINDEIFYDASFWAGETTETVDPIDLENVAQIASVEDLSNWIGTLKTEDVANALLNAGVPEEVLTGGQAQ